jgi:predicted chitinase
MDFAGVRNGAPVLRETRGVAAINMTINRKFFFDNTRLNLFDGAMSADQVAGLTGILDKWEKEMAADDDRWLAYMLATVHHETGRTMQPVRETFASTDDQAIARLDKAFKNGKLPWVSKPYWRRDADGKSWLGRGYVQLTHKDNYVKMKATTGEDLVASPDSAMKVPVALKILFRGMVEGSFSPGNKLSKYFKGAKEDWRNARKIINGLDKADLVASYGKKYYASISHTT